LGILLGWGSYIFLVWEVMILVQSNKYEWSIIDAPEIVGWNAEYCIAGMVQEFLSHTIFYQEA
jgi:hypothetical protein